MTDAQNIKNTVLALLSSAGGTIAMCFGGWDAGVKILLGIMALDYITGLLLAALWHRSPKTEGGGVSSAAGFKGLIRKIAILGLVWLAALLDRAIEADYIRTTVSLFFIANEAISVIENTALMGIPYPGFVKKMLEELQDSKDGGRGG